MFSPALRPVLFRKHADKYEQALEKNTVHFFMEILGKGIIFDAILSRFSARS